MVDVVVTETGFFDFFRGQVARKLVHDGGYHFKVCHFFSTQRSSGNVPLTVFWDGHDTVGFPIHSFSTFERIKKYDENEDAGDVGKPYSIEVSDTPRWINLYAAANDDVYL